MKKLLPVILALVGLLAGAGAGWSLRPGAAPATEDENAAHYRPAPANTETLRLPGQFVVPLLEEGRVRSMVVMSLALELAQGHGVSLQNQEARLRAVLLQVMFDHANTGGFEGVFTSGETLLLLRRTLRDAARAEIGEALHDILITELLRQEN
ncbi:flagellar basal body-associated protein FliL [Pararhodobacter sp.]|uniref:flagellar basal body-associated protein FliL n=1 Tax=Pararhodobacter sp. TaxID=2127056 RepID=UPI002FDDA617